MLHRKEKKRPLKNSAVDESTEDLTESEKEINGVFSNISLLLRGTGVRNLSLQWRNGYVNPKTARTEQKLLLTDTTVHVLATIQKELTILLAEEKQKRSAVRIQANVRGWLVRKNTQKMFQLIPQVRIARSIFIELLATERYYITRLNEAIQEYLLPLRGKACGCSEDLQDVIAIFCNIETIVEVHQNLYEGLVDIQSNSWPVVVGLGRLFLRYASNFQIYGDFAENYITSQATLKKVLGQRKNRLRDTIENEAAGGENLQKILKMPLQRIEKYENVFGAFCSVPRGLFPNELDIISRAHVIIQNINELVTRNLQRADQFAANQEIQRSIITDRPLNLQQDSRFLVGKGSVMCASLKKLNYFLFNDVIIFTKAQGEKYRLVHLIPLEKASLEPCTDKNAKESFEFTFDGGKMRLQEIKKQQDSANHIQIIRDQISKHKKTEVVIGVHLTEILEREGYTEGSSHSGIPKLVSFLINYLRENAIKTEGLLRLPGNFEKIEIVRKILDNAKLTFYNDIDLSKYNVHDVAAVLRIFFRELPEPVIPFDMYEPLLQIQRNANILLDDRIEQIKKVLVNIPPAHLPMLRYLIKFLQDVEEQSEFNKMTVSNLAIVFGPNIIKPKVETVQNALEMPLLQGIIQILMEHSDLFWEEKDADVSIRRRSTICRDRPLSLLFVGTDLTALLDKEVEVSQASELTFRSLARSSPGCKPDINSYDDHGSSLEEEDSESEKPQSPRKTPRASFSANVGQKAGRSNSGEIIPISPRAVSPPMKRVDQRRASEPISPHRIDAHQDIRETFKKIPASETKIKTTDQPSHGRSLSGHVPFRKKKVKRLLNL